MRPIVPSPALLAAAERELELRERLWPMQVQGRRATAEEAEADLTAWREIRHWAAGKAQLLPAAAERLAAVLVEAEARRWQGMVAPDDDRHDARARRLADTNALGHALECFRIRHGWTRHPARALPGFDEAA